MIEETSFDHLSDDKKRELAFNIVAGVRDALSIAKKTIPPTYEQSLRLVHDIDPVLYEFCSRQLQSKNENDTAKLYKERADAESLKEGRQITPIELLEKEISNYKELLSTPGLEKERTKFLKSYIANLEAAIENLKPRRLSEHRILERDFCKVDRSCLGLEKHFESDNYVDYKFAEDRFLRVRLLHPDKPEHILGADLIYEQYHVEEEKLRIAVLQYKTWEDGILYFSSSSNLEAQLKKLEGNLCKNGLCDRPKHLEGKRDYRFPYCAGFLRPTDKLQNSNSKMISHGIHIPVCSSLQIKEDNGKIEKNQIRHATLTHEVFENLFNHGYLGSRWLPVKDIEEIYKRMMILDESRSLKIYAKEIIGKPLEV